MFAKKNETKEVLTSEQKIERLEKTNRINMIASGALFVGMTLLSVAQYKSSKKPAEQVKQ